MQLKGLWILLISQTILHANGQLLVVIAPDMNATKAQLQRYEKQGTHYMKVGKVLRVNIGRHGLGWSIDRHPFIIGTSPLKHEGDGRTPAGIFELGQVFGNADHLLTSMPYLPTTADMVCIDDATSKDYNRIKRLRHTAPFKSFEWMRRNDDLYRLGVTVRHNVDNRPKMGSCIFLHLETKEASPTAGCTSMSYDALERIVHWLNPNQHPLLIQIPQASCVQVASHFNGITCP